MSLAAVAVAVCGVRIDDVAKSGAAVAKPADSTAAAGDINVAFSEAKVPVIDNSA